MLLLCINRRVVLLGKICDFHNDENDKVFDGILIIFN